MGHAVQLDENANTWYWPIWQLVHTDAEAKENCPDAHVAVTADRPVVPQ